MQAQPKNIRGATFYFQNCANSVSQSRVKTTGNLQPIEKIVLYIISQGQLTPCLG